MPKTDDTSAATTLDVLRAKLVDWRAVVDGLEFIGRTIDVAERAVLEFVCAGVRVIDVFEAVRALDAVRAFVALRTFFAVRVTPDVRGVIVEVLWPDAPRAG